MKRLIKWSLDGSILKLSKALEDPKAVAVIEAEFDLSKIYPAWSEMTEVQQHVVSYGARQILMDTGANAVGEAGSKISQAKAKWQDLLDGKVKGDRINATGAAENKKILAAVKEASQVVSLNGLLIKKAVNPEKFTEEDEAKLQEFLQQLGEISKKGIKK